MQIKKQSLQNHNTLESIQEEEANVSGPAEVVAVVAAEGLSGAIVDVIERCAAETVFVIVMGVGTGVGETA